MARINIEDQFWFDCMAVSQRGIDIDKVLGNALRFIRFSQGAFKEGKIIGDEEFKAQGFLEELIPIFARRTENGIEAVGAQKHFSWLLDKSEAGQVGGRISAQRERDASGRLLSKQTPSKLQADPSTPSTLQASPSFSLSSSVLTSSSQLREKEKLTSSSNITAGFNLPAASEDLKKPTPVKNTTIVKSKHEAKSSIAWKAYSTAYELRWNVRPPRDKIANSILCKLIDSLGVQDTPLVAEFYLTHNEPFYVNAKHPLELLYRDRAKLLVESKSGVPVTMREVRKSEESNHHRNQLRLVDEGLI